MKLFGQLVRTAVNTALLPVAVVKDVATAVIDAGEGRAIGHRTKKQIETLKDEAQEK